MLIGYQRLFIEDQFCSKYFLNNRIPAFVLDSENCKEVSEVLKFLGILPVSFVSNFVVDILETESEK